MTIEEIKKILEQAQLKVSQRKNEQIANSLVKAIGDSKMNKEELLMAIKSIKIDVPQAQVPKAEVDVRIPEISVPEATVKVEIPEIKVPTPQVTVNVPDVIVPEIKLPVFNIPEIKVPKIPKPEVTVNIPEIKIPKPEWPKERMPIDGTVDLRGIGIENPLPVQLRDSDGKPFRFPEMTGGGGGGRIVKERKPTNAHIYNIAMLAGNTEYSQELPSNTVAMTIQSREGEDLRVAYTIGKVANSTACFFTVKGGMTYYETHLDLSGKTLYVASERSGTAEVITYD